MSVQLLLYFTATVNNQVTRKNFTKALEGLQTALEAESKSKVQNHY